MVGLTALWLGSGAGLYLAVSRGQEEQSHRLEQLAGEVALVREALGVRPPEEREAPVPARLSAEELDALAMRVAFLVQRHAGAPAAPVAPPSSREPESPPSSPLNVEQKESLARATGMVERVVATGRMSREEVESIRRELSFLGPRPEAQALRQQLIVAVNRGRLVPPEGTPNWIP
jgi:hypothetical protein